MVDSDLAQSLVPAVLCAPYREVKNAGLCGGMYEYMTGRFGVGRSQGGRTRNRKRKRCHERDMKRLTKEKNAVKKELR